MAKKLKIMINEVQRASNALKDFQIEHVVVKYPKTDSVFIIVLNKDKEKALQAIKEAKVNVHNVSGTRHYEHYGKNHTYWYPKFQCKCRCCGKQFESLVKEAVWCSPKCKSEFRKAKKML